MWSQAARGASADPPARRGCQRRVLNALVSRGSNQGIPHPEDGSRVATGSGYDVSLERLVLPTQLGGVVQEQGWGAPMTPSLRMQVAVCV